ncbi:hypothetical protein H5410_027373 [Solanum commersonii]|uniref:DUF4283 domain-containing protein n=1 Tax=Solanum commersonii TaxID=4109 RepID=A0A9J5YZ14_SOLCO|nr:hypothetical protein H5410_027373 [Solanum commersonii]
MEHWPPLPSRGATPNSKEVDKPNGNWGVQFLLKLVGTYQVRCKEVRQEVKHRGTRGMSLGYFNPVMKNGEHGSHQKFLQLRGILYCRRIQLGNLKYYHNDGYFLVRFANLDERNKILYSSPHMLNNKPIIVTVWSANFNFNKEILQTVQIWVKYPNLSLNS